VLTIRPRRSEFSMCTCCYSETYILKHFKMVYTRIMTLLLALVSGYVQLYLILSKHMNMAAFLRRSLYRYASTQSAVPGRKLKIAFFPHLGCYVSNTGGLHPQRGLAARRTIYSAPDSCNYHEFPPTGVQWIESYGRKTER
jgi:hypothetical protein